MTKPSQKDRITELFQKFDQTFKQDSLQALEYAREAETLSEKIKFDEGVSTSKRYIGSIYFRFGEYAEAIKHYQEALIIEKSLQRDKDIAGLLSNIGSVHGVIGNLAQAEKFHLEALELSRKLDDINGIARALNNLGLCYKEGEEYDRAIEHFERAINLRSDSEGSYGNCFTFNNLAIVYDKQHEYEKAIEFYNKALTIYRQLNDSRGECSAILNLGNCCLEQEKVDTAEQHIQEGLKLSKDNGFIDQQKYALESMSNVCEAKGDFKRALEFLRRSIEIGKKIYNENNIRTISRLQAKFELRHKEHEIGKLSDQQKQLASALREKVDELETKSKQLQDEINKRKETEIQLRKKRDDLEKAVSERTEEVRQRIKDTESLNRAMINLLEDQKASNVILERTSKRLAEANQDLESFAYSVSHDLRAPLRAIDGYSKMLSEDFSDVLGEDGNHQIDVIRESTTSMGKLIDGLLLFSRLGRKGLRFSVIDMRALIGEVLAEQEHDLQNDKVDFILKEALDIYGDRTMMKEVVANLISNSMKYRKPDSSVVIEIGSQKDDDAVVYYFKDNGIGFDMKYVDKIFQVFQRLHAVSAYSGTGIGLALAQRILIRHSGTIWAEGEPERGATFYFKIPEKRKID